MSKSIQSLFYSSPHPYNEVCDEFFAVRDSSLQFVVQTSRDVVQLFGLGPPRDKNFPMKMNVHFFKTLQHCAVHSLSSICDLCALTFRDLG